MDSWWSAVTSDVSVSFPLFFLSSLIRARLAGVAGLFSFSFPLAESSPLAAGRSVLAAHSHAKVASIPYSSLFLMSTLFVKLPPLVKRRPQTLFAALFFLPLETLDTCREAAAFKHAAIPPDRCAFFPNFPVPLVPRRCVLIFFPPMQILSPRCIVNISLISRKTASEAIQLFRFSLAKRVVGPVFFFCDSPSPFVGRQNILERRLAIRNSRPQPSDFFPTNSFSHESRVVDRTPFLLVRAFVENSPARSRPPKCAHSHEVASPHVPIVEKHEAHTVRDPRFRVVRKIPYSKC